MNLNDERQTKDRDEGQVNFFYFIYYDKVFFLVLKSPVF